MMGKYKVGENPIRNFFGFFKISENKFIFFAVLLSFLFTSFAFADNIKFSYKGNTLFWEYNGKSNYLKLQLDHLNPPTINQDPIIRIQKQAKSGGKLWIFTKSKCWILHYSGNPETDWYIEDWYPL